MSDDTDIIRGSGNVSRDLGHPDADPPLWALTARQSLDLTDVQGSGVSPPVSGSDV